MMDSPSRTPPLGKYLASSDKKTRDKAIKHLSGFLSTNSQDPLPKSELAKLWKGIFYCYWMSDKPLVQQALSSELAELLLTISTTSASLAFLQAFWDATVREWNGIDRLRLDKYYMLVRKFTNAAFRLLIRVNWQQDACDEYNSILSCKGGPLCPDDIRVPSSLAYHLADIYLEELDKAVSINPSRCKCPPVPLSTILFPFLSLAARTSSNTTYARLQSSLFTPLILALPSTCAESLSGSEGTNQQRSRRETEPEFQHLLHNSCSVTGEDTAPGGLRKALLRDIFDIASREDTRDANRRKMYAIWKEGTDDDRRGTDMDAR